MSLPYLEERGRPGILPSWRERSRDRWRHFERRWDFGLQGLAVLGAHLLGCAEGGPLPEVSGLKNALAHPISPKRRRA